MINKQVAGFEPTILCPEKVYEILQTKGNYDLACLANSALNSTSRSSVMSIPSNDYRQRPKRVRVKVLFSCVYLILRNLLAVILKLEHYVSAAEVLRHREPKYRCVAGSESSN